MDFGAGRAQQTNGRRSQSSGGPCCSLYGLEDISFCFSARILEFPGPDSLSRTSHLWGQESWPQANPAKAAAVLCMWFLPAAFSPGQHLMNTPLDWDIVPIGEECLLSLFRSVGPQMKQLPAQAVIYSQGDKALTLKTFRSSPPLCSCCSDSV